MRLRAANSDGYEVFYFSLNPTSAEDATAEELAQLRAQISDIQVVFRDYASGEIEVDSFDSRQLRRPECRV